MIDPKDTPIPEPTDAELTDIEVNIDSIFDDIDDDDFL
tara:strand:- start:210 stop:323 length:114 start_codon:yes stop_codon:yes gene_type:complete